MAPPLKPQYADDRMSKVAGSTPAAVVRFSGCKNRSLLVLEYYLWSKLIGFIMVSLGHQSLPSADFSRLDEEEASPGGWEAITTSRAMFIQTKSTLDIFHYSHNY
ncbi:hypothetical protein TNCV_2069831 [Trichonephila clavipes]|uniref:Uncharacterized protein n=1 Tax=Trichonephila clavipes TaxID=2585209 RepID=A0A8X7BDE9_TRICX|nr:hypothetical protein TNCV_2069831 [Trichonephila clavipes]